LPNHRFLPFTLNRREETESSRRKTAMPHMKDCYEIFVVVTGTMLWRGSLHSSLLGCRCVEECGVGENHARTQSEQAEALVGWASGQAAVGFDTSAARLTDGREEHEQRERGDSPRGQTRLTTGGPAPRPHSPRRRSSCIDGGAPACLSVTR